MGQKFDFGITEKFKKHSMKRAALFIVAAFLAIGLTPKASIFAIIAVSLFGAAQIYFGLILYAKYWNRPTKGIRP